MTKQMAGWEVSQVAFRETEKLRTNSKTRLSIREVFVKKISLNIMKIEYPMLVALVAVIFTLVSAEQWRRTKSGGRRVYPVEGQPFLVYGTTIGRKFFVTF